MLKMDAQVAELIRSTAAPAGATVSGITYANVFGAKSRFNVVPAKLSNFLDTYCTLAAQDEALEESSETPDRLGLSIAEVAMTKTLPLSITMMFRFNLSMEARDDPGLYGEDFIKACVNSIQDLMGHLLALSAQTSEIICPVLETKPWHVGETTFTRLRFQFPYAQVDAGYQQRIFKPALIKVLRARKVIARMEVQPIGDWDTIIEDVTQQNGVAIVPMYRSKDDAAHCPLTLSHIYQYISDEHITSHEIKELELKAVFAPTHHSFVYTNRVSNSFLAKEVDIHHWLPLFLSINFWSGVVNPKALDVAEPGTPMGAMEGDETITSKDPVQILRRLLPLLATMRFDLEPFWIDIGRVLYNSTSGCEEGLNLWIQYSARSNQPGRDKAACISKYYTLRGTPLSWKTIAWFAKEDAPSGYQEWHDAWCHHALNDALSGVHDDVAEAVYRYFFLDYMCSGMAKNAWYKFSGHGLKPLDDAVYLRTDITEKLVRTYKEIRVTLTQESAQIGKDADRKGIEIRIKQIGDLIKKLGTQGYRTAIITMCREKFYVPDFDKWRDADATRTGWANCVIECCGDKAYPRAGKPEDFITMNTGIAYSSTFSWEDPLVIELMTWLKQCFPDEALLRYFLKDAAAMLLGRNAEKLFRAWIGENGDNSKSMIVKLFQATLGIYCIDFPAEMLMKSMNRGSGPSPELAQSRGAHMGIIAEPDETDDIQAGKVKRYTGGDRFFGRMCNENGGSIENFVKLIYMANRIPNIPGADKAVRNRLQILPFLSTWIKSDDPSPAPDDPAEQMAQRRFKMDPFFERRIPDLAHAFIWVMVEYFSIYRVEGLKPPNIVIDHTNRHWEDNDPFLNFIRERIAYAFKPDPTGMAKPDVDTNVSVTASDLFPVFRLWYTEAYPGATKITQPIFTTHMKQAGRLGPQNSKKRWVGIRVNISTDTNVPALGG